MNDSEKKIQESQNPHVGKIDKVDSIESFHKSTDGKWIPILKAFNPFGAIAESYAKTLAYKIETKRLDVELVRIKEQANIAHNVIDKSFRLKITELENRRISLIVFYQTVNNELEKLHIERIKVLEMAQFAQQQAFLPELSIEERKLFAEMSIETTKLLPIFGDKSNESLQNLILALPPVAISSKLL